MIVSLVTREKPSLITRGGAVRPDGAPRPRFTLLFARRSLWFVLEILMAKNENNSHAFIRKMVENIKQTKDGQVPNDPKINEVGPGSPADRQGARPRP